MSRIQLDAYGITKNQLFRQKLIKDQRPKKFLNCDSCKKKRFWILFILNLYGKSTYTTTLWLMYLFSLVFMYFSVYKCWRTFKNAKFPNGFQVQVLEIFNSKAFIFQIHESKYYNNIENISVFLSGRIFFSRKVKFVYYYYLLVCHFLKIVQNI